MLFVCFRPALLHEGLWPLLAQYIQNQPKRFRLGRYQQAVPAGQHKFDLGFRAPHWLGLDQRERYRLALRAE